jgi:hypothetical protein
VAGGWGLEVVDLTNPATPVRSHLFQTNGPIEDVAVFGGYAYVANYAIGMHVMDLNDPTTTALTDGRGTCGGQQTGYPESQHVKGMADQPDVHLLELELEALLELEEEGAVLR